MTTRCQNQAQLLNQSQSEQRLPKGLEKSIKHSFMRKQELAEDTVATEQASAGKLFRITLRFRNRFKLGKSPGSTIKKQVNKANF